jgi:hypothetical protein
MRNAFIAQRRCSNASRISAFNLPEVSCPRKTMHAAFEGQRRRCWVPAASPTDNSILSTEHGGRWSVRAPCVPIISPCRHPRGAGMHAGCLHTAGPSELRRGDGACPLPAAPPVHSRHTRAGSETDFPAVMCGSCLLSLPESPEGRPSMHLPTSARQSLPAGLD